MVSEEVAGRRVLRTEHGTYIRANIGSGTLDCAPHARRCEQWFVEDWGDKVVFRANDPSARYIRANPDGTVDLATLPQSHETWMPHSNSDGSWSFQSTHGQWLCGAGDGTVWAQRHKRSSERFWLERW